MPYSYEMSPSSGECVTTAAQRVECGTLRAQTHPMGFLKAIFNFSVALQDSDVQM